MLKIEMLASSYTSLSRLWKQSTTVTFIEKWQFKFYIAFLFINLGEGHMPLCSCRAWGQFTGIGIFPSSCGSQGQNSGKMAGKQAPLPA